MINSGVGGEDTKEGLRRISRTLDAEHPDVLLLLEGVNNVKNDGASAVASDLRQMVNIAKNRGIDVFIATLTPISDGREALHEGTRAAINELNPKIIDLADDLNITAVDLNTAFGDDRELLGPDGFHPSNLGHRRMADEFYEAITDRLQKQLRSLTD